MSDSPLTDAAILDDLEQKIRYEIDYWPSSTSCDDDDHFSLFREMLDTVRDYRREHAENVRLRARVGELETGIRSHRDQKSDDRCWLDDEALYALLPGESSTDMILPPKCEFLASCERYWEQRQAPIEKVVKLPQMTIRQLEDRVAELEAEIARLRENTANDGPFGGEMDL